MLAWKKDNKHIQPFVGSLFVNDEQFIKVCKNFNHYMSIKPRFDKPSKKSIWATQTGYEWYRHDEIEIPYPVMYLDDIEIHWIHEKDQTILLEKYNRRISRYMKIKPTCIFMLSDADLLNDHSSENYKIMIDNFINIPTSIFLTKYEYISKTHSRIYLMKEWIGSADTRNYSNLPDIHIIGNRIDEFKNIIGNLSPFTPNIKIKSLKTRESVPIENKYHINSFGDYTLNIYYISDNSCEVKILRHDEDYKGIYVDIIFDDTGEYITLKSSEKSCYTFIINTTKTVLKPLIFTPNQLIPKTIIQTNENNNYKNNLDMNAQSSIIDANPEYDYIFYNSTERRNFMKQNFDINIVSAYDTLVSGAYQSDMFRYAYLYINGGCYLDFKMISRVPLREIIKPDDDFLICIDYEKTNVVSKNIGKSFLNSPIMTIPKNILLLNTLNMCAYNIKNNQSTFLEESKHGGCQKILDITGPTLFYTCLNDKISEKQIRFKHFIINNDETIYKNFQIFDLDQNKEIFSKSHKSYCYDNHYSELWNKNELFYRNFSIIGHLHIYVYPMPYDDKFTFELMDKNILRIFSCSKEGWWADLKIKIINNITSETFNIIVGRNCSGVKDIFI
jgi:hypothetical protein